MPTNTELPRVTARERLLAAADELFYQEGVHTVGIDRIIERAGVAKASLYNTFGSKDELVRAYLTARHDARLRRIDEHMARYEAPRDKMLAVFEAQADISALPGFRGCAFLNASAESPPGSVAEQVSDANRVWLRELFTSLATEAGARDPSALARQLIVLYDGASVGARMDHTRAAPDSARAIAELLIDAAV